MIAPAMTTTPDPLELDSILRRELMPGERLLWSGRPLPGKLRAAFAAEYSTAPRI